MNWNGRVLFWDDAIKFVPVIRFFGGLVIKWFSHVNSRSCMLNIHQLNLRLHFYPTVN